MGWQGNTPRHHITLEMSQVPVELKVSRGLVAYLEAVAAMEARVAAIHAGTAPELLWFLEHPPLYTAGTSAQENELLLPDKFPVFKTGRGGQYTYHGPGQRVVYVVLDLKKRGEDVRCFVRDLEDCIIKALGTLGVTGERREGRIGIWVARNDGAMAREDKIGAIGVRVRHWVTYHGLAINVSPDLTNFAGIVPCGVTSHGVTSLADLGIKVGMADLDAALKAAFTDVFNLQLQII
jgi:lipoyl(octanoyl) transferase